MLFETRPPQISVVGPVPKGRFYRPELDALRFLAFFMVFMSHALPNKATSSHLLMAVRETGALGVPIFFMLSAFLITELLLRERASSQTIDIRAFYIRRVLRIWPLYFAVLIVGFVVLRISPGPQMSVVALIAYVALVGNWYTITAGFLPGGLGQLWSIGVEEQFYLIWPSILRYFDRALILLLLVAFWLGSQLTVFVLCYLHAPTRPNIWANSLAQMQYFAIGALVSFLLRGRIPRLNIASRVALVTAGSALVFSANYVFQTLLNPQTSSVEHTYPGYLLAGIGAAFIFLGIFGVRVPKRLQVFSWLGKISYGLYVYHVPCILFSIGVANLVFHMTSAHYAVAFLIGFPLTLAVSVLSYRYFETPFLRIKERFEIVKSRPA